MGSEAGAKDLSRTVGPRGRTESLLHAVVAGAALACLYLLAQPRLWDGEHFLGWDIVYQAWPNLTYLSRALSEFSLPLWNPYEKGGYAFIADPESALLYPVSWALCVLDRAFELGPQIMLVQVLVHIAIAAAGTWMYLQRLGLPTAARWFGASAFVLSACLFRFKDQTVLGTVAWLPWMLLAAHHALRKPSWRSGLVLGLAIGLDVLAGYPPNAFRNLLVLGSVGVFDLVEQLRAHTSRGLYLRRLVRSVLLAAGTSVALAAPVLVAVSHVYPDSKRSTLTRAQLLASPVDISDALSLFAPALQRHTPLLYVGLIPLLLAIVALGRPSGRRWLWAGLAVSFLLLSCGSNAFLLPALLDGLPIFRAWRIPEQYLYVFSFFVALLAARGLADALTASRQRLRSARAAGTISASFMTVVCISALVVTRLAPRPDSALVELAHSGVFLLFLALICVAGLLSANPKLRTYAAWAALPILLLDAALQVEPVHKIVQRRPDLSRDAELLALPGVKDGGLARIAESYYFPYRVGARLGVREIFGRRTALTSNRFEKYVELASHRYDMLAAANVRYYAGVRWREIKDQGGDRVQKVGSQVVELTKRVPFAFWHGAPQIVADKDQALQALQRSGAAGVAIVELGDLSLEERQALRPPSPSGRLVPARVERFSRHAVRLAVEAPSDGVLIINERFAPGWRATIDGTPARVFRANYLFRGVRLPKGAHKVELVYRPFDIVAALLLYAATLLAALGCLVRRATVSAWA